VRTLPVPTGHRGRDPAGLAAPPRRAGPAAKPAADAAAAMAEIVARAPPGPALLMIAGSHDLAGAILAENG
jgi:hypothetical protein